MMHHSSGRDGASCCWRADSDLCLGGSVGRDQPGGRGAVGLGGIAGNCWELLPHPMGAPPGIPQEGSAGWALLARSILGQRGGIAGDAVGADRRHLQGANPANPSPARSSHSLLGAGSSSSSCCSPRSPLLLLPAGKADFTRWQSPLCQRGEPTAWGETFPFLERARGGKLLREG